MSSRTVPESHREGEVDGIADHPAELPDEDIEPLGRPNTLADAFMSFLRVCFPGRGALLIAVLTCVVAPVLLVAVHVHENPEFSPIDEAAHYDYIVRIANGGFPRMGQSLQPSTLRALSCRKTALVGMVTPPCGQKVLKPSEFAGGGYQYEAQQPPTYYAITVPLRWLAIHVFGFSDVPGTRLTGALWLVAALLLLWAAGRLIGLRPSVLGAGALLLGAAPVALYQSATISNDVPDLFAGSLIAFLGLLSWRHPGRWVAPVLGISAFFVASLKAVDVFPVVVIASLLAIVGWQRARSEGALSRVAAARAALVSWLPNGGALLIGGFFSVAAWAVIQKKLALIDPRDLPTFNVLRTHPVGPLLIAQEAVGLLGPLTNSYVAFRSSNLATTVVSVRATYLEQVYSHCLTYLVLAGGLAGLFVSRRRLSHWIGLLTVPALYFGGFALGLSLWLTYNTDPGLSGRYGLSLAPLLALALIGAVRGLWVERGIWAFAIAGFGLDLWLMLAR